MIRTPLTRQLLLVTVTSVLTVVLLFTPSAGYAYVGPSIGISLLSALVTVFVAIFIAIGGIMIWPIRSWLRRRSKARKAVMGGEAGKTTGESAKESKKGVKEVEGGEMTEKTAGKG